MEDLLLEIIDSAKVEALDELMSEAEYWEMKAEIKYGYFLIWPVTEVRTLYLIIVLQIVLK